MARPAFLENGAPDSAMAEVRGYFENRVRHWHDSEKSAKPRWDAEVVSTAAALAINDQLTTGKLHETTRKALDRMWTLQKPDGAWNWLKAKLPPYEYDDYYGALVAALGVGYAPDQYATGESARKGVDSLRSYFKKNPPPNLHHEAFLLWASARLDGLMSSEQRNRTIHRLRSLQRTDGGWCLPSLGEWKRHDGSSNDPKAPSDGYATGLVVYVLRQAGIPPSDPTLVKGVAWLKNNQRESGRWFTRSLNTDNKHYISNAGTAFAAMALHACDAIHTKVETGSR
jgi:squalene-hopene/tetraprenyl-beta-curcumene cyclase